MIDYDKPSRSCGECSACCKILAIDELKKPPSIWCQHVKIGQGCEIYENRPASCRKFNCLWILDPRLPDEMRPDKSHVVLHVQKEMGRLKVNVDPDTPEAWQRGLTRKYIEMVRKTGVDVLIVVGDKKNLQKMYTADDTEVESILLTDTPRQTVR
jgi:hypothetical protein